MAKRLWLMFGALGVILLFSFGLAPSGSSSTVQADTVPYQVGDVFAGIGAGKISQYRPFTNTIGATLVATLTTASGSDEQTGMCFDPTGNLYATNHYAGTMSRFNSLGVLINPVWASGFQFFPESCVQDQDGNFYVGEVSPLGQSNTPNRLRKFDPNGTQLATFNPVKDNRGIDWIDLAADNCTIYYTSESDRIMRFNVCTNTQINGVNNPWVANLDGVTGVCYALRIRPNGEVMVTCSNNVYRLDPTGNLIRTYPKPLVEPSDFRMFAMNLDPTPDPVTGNMFFWTGIYQNGHIYKINIDTGAVVNQFTAPGQGSQQLMSGLAVFGEIAGGPPPPTPTATPPPPPLITSELLGSFNPGIRYLQGQCGCHPINSANGNFWHTFTDLVVPGRGLALHFARTYNAQAAFAIGPLGYGWTHSYNLWIDSDSTNYYVHQENGSVAPFPKAGAPYPRVLAQLTHNPDGTFVFTYTHGLDRYDFDAAGKLTRETDRNGYATTLSYQAGRLRTVTDPAGRTLTFTYTNQLLTSVGDSTGRTVVFDYDYTNQDLTAATDVGQQITHFSYYPNHLMQTMTYPNSGQVTNVYDGNARVLTQTDPMSRTLQFAYSVPDAGHTQTLVTDTLGYMSVYTYDTSSRLTAFTRNPGPQQATWQYSFDPNYPLAIASVTDPNDHTWNQTYDAQANLREADDPLGRVTNYEYSATNDLLVVTDARGLTTTLTYDTYGNPLTITRPVTETDELAVTRFGYDPARPGDVLTVTNPLGHSWSSRYDTYGYVVSTTNPLTETAQFTHDALGRLRSMTDPLNHTSAVDYNAYGAPIRITDTLGYVSTYSYDASQNLHTITNTKGLTTTYTYNLDNQVTRVTYADGTHSDYGYDGNGNVLTQTNALSQTTRYGYDPFNRVIRVTDPLTRSTGYEYDLVGNPLVMTDALGLATSYEYDAANQLEAIKHGDFTTPNVFFDYNDLGQRIAMWDDNGTTSYSYDSLSRLTRVENGAGAVVGYQYDLAGNRTGIVYPGGVGTVTQEYDAANRLRTVRDWLSHTTSFDYDHNGALVQQSYPNGVQLALGRDAAGQVITLTQTITATPFLSVTYVHDPLGLLSSATEAGVGSNGYGYDPRNRLIGDQLTAGTPISRTWSYDGATEITATRYQPGVQTPLTSTRGYDAANELRSLIEQQGSTVTRNLSLDYDANGNRTSQIDSVSSVTTTYTYDEHNRLLSVEAPGIHPVYQYDGDGLRVQNTPQIACLGCADHLYTWDVGAGLPLLLQDTAYVIQDNSTARTSYIYGPGGQILEQVQPNGTVYYYHADRLGSVRALTNAAGEVVATYAYDAYGTTTASTGSSANPFRYAGEYQDAETGLYYLRARYYDPATQQFLTRDPLVAATEQAYNYAEGSPLNATDPSGMNPYGCLGLFGTGCLERLRANSCYYFDLFCTAQEAQENAARRADEAAQHANDGLQWACAQGVASACAEVGRQLGNVLCSIVPSWQPPNPGGVPGARPATASELRQWAQSQGYRQRPGTGTPQGGPETWEDPVTGDWKLKLKEPSTQPGLASGSNVDRYSAKDAAGNYYDPITGVSGTRTQLGHLPLIWK